MIMRITLTFLKNWYRMLMMHRQQKLNSLLIGGGILIHLCFQRIWNLGRVLPWSFIMMPHSLTEIMTTSVKLPGKQKWVIPWKQGALALASVQRITLLTYPASLQENTSQCLILTLSILVIELTLKTLAWELT